MKRFFAILVSVTLILSLGISAFVTTASQTYFSVYTGDSTQTYNPNQKVTVALSLRDINVNENDGISAFEFDIYYDKTMIVPVMETGEATEEFDPYDYTALLANNTGIDSWEGDGVLDAQIGKYNIAFSMIEDDSVITSDDVLVINIPFVTTAAARVDDIVFRFENVIAYSRDMEIKYEGDIDDVSIAYAVQPEIKTEIPEGTIPLDVAGYRNDSSNFIYYSKEGTTVSNFVKTYFSSAQNILGEYGILIAKADGVIINVDMSVGKDSDKSNIFIPSKSYIIGVNANTDEFQIFSDSAEVRGQVLLYNVNVESTGRNTVAIDLENAAFALVAAPELPVEPEVSENESSKPEISDDESSNEESGDVSDGETGSAYRLGDLNRNGRIDMTDYVLLKRAYFQTFVLDDEQKILGDCNKNSKIDMTDYVLLKRAYFGTFVLKG